MNHLFICTNNQIRSPAAEKVFRGMLKEIKKKAGVKSVGISPAAPTQVTFHLLQWADKIFCMEEEHKLYITYLYPELEKKIKVLNIFDAYRKGDPELIKILKGKLWGECNIGGNKK